MTMSKVSSLVSKDIGNYLTNRASWNIFYNAKSEGMKGDGTTDDYAALSTLINTKINGAEATIIFSPGTYKISTNITIPSNVNLYLTKGAMLSPDSGKTITINGPIEAGLWKIFTGSGTIVGNPKIDVVYPEWWGAKGDGVTDDTTPVSSANTFTRQQSSPSILEFTSGTYKITSMLTINPMRTSITGSGGTVLDFSSMVSGSCFRFEGVGTAGESISSNKTRSWEGFRIKGNSNLTLVDVSSDTGTSDSAAITFEHVCFDTCDKGVSIGNDAWQLMFRTCSFVGFNYGAYMLQDNDPTVTNFGEAVTFDNCLFSGVGLAYYSRNYNSDAHFVNNCSFDSSTWFDVARGAKAYVSDAHFETQQDTAIPFKIEGTVDGFSGAYLSIRDSWLIMPGGLKTQPLFQVGFDYSVGNGGLNVDGLFTNYEVAATNTTLVKGNGKVTFRGLKTNFDFKNYVIAESINELVDGGFESSTVSGSDVGDWDIVDAAAPPSIDATVFHSGTKSLKMVGGGTTIVGVTSQRVVKPGQNVFWGVWYKLASVVSGGASFKVFNLFAKIYDRNNNVITTMNEEIYLSGTVDWTFYTSTILKQNAMPKGADHIIVTIQMNQCTGDAWVDDVTINIID